MNNNLCISLLQTTKHLSHLSTRQQSEDSIHKQLAAFERLLQHSMSRYSNEKTYSLLRHITRWAEANEKKTSSKNTQFKLTSINQLQDTVELMKSKSKSKSGDDETIYKTFDLFLNDLLYLKDLKKYFDDEIFAALMKYHYEPNVPLSNTTETNGGMKHIRTTKMENADSDSGSQIDTDEQRVFQKVSKARKKKERPPSLGNDDDDKQYKDTVAALRVILKKWDGLLSEEALDLDDFDPDSYHELMQFSNYTQFESLLRLVPDIFAKCYKSIDLAKTWLRLSNIVMQDEISVNSISPEGEKVNQRIPGDEESKESEKTTKQFLKEVRDIQKQIQDVDKSIGDDVALLHRYNREMDVLVGRDERFSTVSSHMDKIEYLMTIAAGEYQKSKTEQYSVASKLKSCRKGTPTYGEMKNNLKKLDNEVARNHWKIKRLEFERTMYQEDLLVEAEVRPSFIRFIGDTKEKMSDLENLLSVKREEKLKLEKQLALMKTNTDRMRKIMRTYLGSASTHGDVSRESSLMSTPDALSDIPLDDGNEADDDSPGPFEKDEDHHDHHKHSSGASPLKPTLATKSIRPSSERLSETSPKPLPNLGRVSRVGPKAALKTTPRRVWENV